MCNEIWHLVGCLPYIYRMWVNKTSYQTATFEAAKRAHAPRPHAA
jgi:hypothetical protein